MSKGQQAGLYRGAIPLALRNKIRWFTGRHMQWQIRTRYLISFSVKPLFCRPGGSYDLLSPISHPVTIYRADSGSVSEEIYFNFWLQSRHRFPQTSYSTGCWSKGILHGAKVNAQQDPVSLLPLRILRQHIQENLEQKCLVKGERYEFAKPLPDTSLIIIP